MSENNKRNLRYFEAQSMRDLYEGMESWQIEHQKRLLSVNIQREEHGFSCIALTNPSEVIIVDGSAHGGAAVRAVGGFFKINHLATVRQKCFPGTARVQTATGTRPIAEIEQGDLIVSYCSDGTTTLRPVTRKLAHKKCIIHRVVLSQGAPLRATENHRVLTGRGWLMLRDLRPGDKLVRTNGDSVVVEIQAELTPEPVYNLFTAGEHNFVVEGVVVHNFTNFRVVRTLMHRVFVDPFVVGNLPERIVTN
jgi:hypothetical protein